MINILDLYYCLITNIAIKISIRFYLKVFSYFTSKESLKCFCCFSPLNGKAAFNHLQLTPSLLAKEEGSRGECEWVFGALLVLPMMGKWCKKCGTECFALMQPCKTGSLLVDILRVFQKIRDTFLALFWPPSQCDILYYKIPALRTF